MTQEESDLQKQLTEVRSLLACDTLLDTPESQPARLKAAVAQATCAIAKQVPGVAEQQLEPLVQQALAQVTQQAQAAQASLQQAPQLPFPNPLPAAPTPPLPAEPTQPATASELAGMGIEGLPQEGVCGAVVKGAGGEQGP